MNAVHIMLGWLLAAPAWGPKAVPDGEGHWLVRWAGQSRATVDGVPTGAPGVVRVSSDRAHEVQVDGKTLRTRRRPDDPCAPLRFAVLGDGRAAVNGVGPSAYWAAMLQAVIQTKPAFILNTGDLVKVGDSKVEWTRFLSSLPPWPPMLSARGNHDRGGLFEHLGVGVGAVFGWTAGPVFVAGIDTEASEPEFERLAQQLDGLLQRSTAPWKIVFMHRPIYSRGPHGSDERGFNHLLVPIFERNNVQLVFSGHDHNYERFCPLRGQGELRHCTDDGVHYIVTGGGATFTMPFPGFSKFGSQVDRAKNDTQSLVFSGARHFISVDVWRGQLEVTVHKIRAGNLDRRGLMDHFVLVQPDPEACQLERDAGP